MTTTMSNAEKIAFIKANRTLLTVPVKVSAIAGLTEDVLSSLAEEISSKLAEMPTKEEVKTPELPSITPVSTGDRSLFVVKQIETTQGVKDIPVIEMSFVKKEFVELKNKAGKVLSYGTKYTFCVADNANTIHTISHRVITDRDTKQEVILEDKNIYLLDKMNLQPGFLVDFKENFDRNNKPLFNTVVLSNRIIINGISMLQSSFSELVETRTKEEEARAQEISEKISVLNQHGITDATEIAEVLAEDHKDAILDAKEALKALRKK